MNSDFMAATKARLKFIEDKINHFANKDDLI